MTGEYPRHWEADVVLADGGTVHVRPVRPADAGRLLAFHARLSPHALYNRYFAPHPTLTPAEVAHLTEVDHRTRVALVATLRDEIVAVSRYESVPGADDAEVAFVVDDAHQGRGLGSVLLEHLAAAAQERGIRRFTADVLDTNRRMINVFVDAGYQATRSYAEGVVHLTFPIEPTEISRSVMHAREHHAEARSIARLLAPRSIAVVGASRHGGTLGHQVFANLIAAGFPGPVYPVNPAAVAVTGVRAYPRLLAVPGEVDLAVIATPAAAVTSVVDECARKGVHGLVVLSAGFAELGPDGAAAQGDLVACARGNGMRVVGPNCFGLLNTAPTVRLNATPARPMPRAGCVGFFAESGGLGIAILRALAERGLGVSTFVSAGNRADVSGNDLLQYWENDPATEVILLYLERFGNPRKFARLARRVSRVTPIVAVKSGHALAAVPDASADALFRQAGVVRVDTLSQLFDTAQVLAGQPLPAGRRVAVVANAGALAKLTADACIDAGLTVPPLGTATIEALAPALGSRDRVRNPLDLGGNCRPEELTGCVGTVLADDEVDSVVAVFVPPVLHAETDIADLLAAATRRSGKPVVATLLAFDGAGRHFLPGLVPSYDSPEAAVQALARAVEYAEWRRRPPGSLPDLDGVDVDRGRALVDAELPAKGDASDLTPARAAELLACYGVAVVPAPTAGSPEEMTPAGISVIVRAVDDPSFGPVVAFGLAGVAELLGDRAFRTLPMTDRDAADLVRSVRAAPLLFGDDGRPLVDIAAIEDLLLRIATLADDLPAVVALELNPVLATPAGVSVLSATVRVAPPSTPPDTGPRRL